MSEGQCLPGRISRNLFWWTSKVEAVHVDYSETSVISTFTNLPSCSNQIGVAMSMLHIGASCNSCNLVDFLPTLCPSCSQTYCQSHILSHHPCFTTSLRPETNPTAGPSTFAPKAKCDVRGCERVRIEAIGGLESEREGKGAGIGKEIRCTGCQGAFCVLWDPL
jgi:hypothetical protein